MALMVDVRLKVCWTSIVLDAAEQFFDLSQLFSENTFICGCKYSGKMLS
jgi:hypothetical protein